MFPPAVRSLIRVKQQQLLHHLLICRSEKPLRGFRIIGSFSRTLRNFWFQISRSLVMKLLPVLLLLLLVPLLTSCLPLDCDYLYNEDNKRPSGVYTIYPMGGVSGVQVFCDMDSQGGRWTVFQRRMDGSVNFHRNWERYKVGFGNAAGEYWLGLESLFHLTQLKKNELLVDMEDFEGRKVFARYTSFSIAPESDGFRLNVTGFFDGGAGDTLTRHDGQGFVTFDRHLHTAPDNCAKEFLGGFWYFRCYYPNPNGVYLGEADGSKHEVGVIWYSWRGTRYSLKTISMKTRPIRKI